MVTLRRLLAEQPTVFYDAVMLARDPGYRFFSAGALRGAGLVGSDDAMHASVRNVILSAVTGEGLNMLLADPRVS